MNKGKCKVAQEFGEVFLTNKASTHLQIAYLGIAMLAKIIILYMYNHDLSMVVVGISNFLAPCSKTIPLESSFW